MDFGSLLGGIGSFLGGLFGGNQKKQQQNRPQPFNSQPAPAQHNALSLNGPTQTPTTVQPPQPFALPTQPQAPILGGVHQSAPAPKPTVAMPTNLFPLSAQDLNKQFQAQRQQNSTNATAPASGNDPIGHFVHDATTSLLDVADPSKMAQTGVLPSISVPLSLIKGGIDGLIGSGVHVANDLGANVATNVTDPLTKRLLGISNNSEGDTRTAGHDIATSIDGLLGDGKGNGLSKAPQPVQDALGIGNDVLNLSQLGGLLRPIRQLVGTGADALGGVAKADAAIQDGLKITPRDSVSPITTTPTPAKAPAITSPNRPAPAPVVPLRPSVPSAVEPPTITAPVVPISAPKATPTAENPIEIAPTPFDTPEPVSTAPKVPTGEPGQLGSITRNAVIDGSINTPEGITATVAKSEAAANAAAKNAGDTLPNIIKKGQTVYDHSKTAGHDLNTAEAEKAVSGFTPAQQAVYKNYAQEISTLRDRAGYSLKGGHQGEWYGPRQALSETGDSQAFDPSLVNEIRRQGSGSAIPTGELDLSPTPYSHAIQRYANAPDAGAQMIVDRAENDASGAARGIVVPDEAKQELKSNLADITAKRDEALRLQRDGNIKGAKQLGGQIESDINETFNKFADSIPGSGAARNQAIADVKAIRDPYIQSSMESLALSNVVNRVADQGSATLYKAQQPGRRLLDKVLAPIYKNKAQSVDSEALGLNTSTAAIKAAKQTAKGTLMHEIGSNFKANVALAGAGKNALVKGIAKVDAFPRAVTSAGTQAGDISTPNVVKALQLGASRDEAQGLKTVADYNKYYADYMKTDKFKSDLEQVNRTNNSRIGIAGNIGKTEGGTVSKALSKFADNGVKTAAAKIDKVRGGASNLKSNRLVDEANGYVKSNITGFAGVGSRILGFTARSAGFKGLVDAAKMAKSGDPVAAAKATQLASQAIMDATAVYGSAGAAALAAKAGGGVIGYTGAGAKQGSSDSAYNKANSIPRDKWYINTPDGKRVYFDPARALGAPGAVADIVGGALTGDPLTGAKDAATNLINQVGGSSLPQTAVNVQTAFDPTQPDQNVKYAGQQLQQTLAPATGVLNNIANLQDPTKRAPTNFVDDLKSNLPDVGPVKLRSSTPAAKDSQGNTLPNTEQLSGGSSQLQFAKNPDAPASSNNANGPSALDTEINRLQKISGDVFPTTSNTNASNAGVKDLAGALVNDPIYTKADDKTKASMLKGVLAGTSTKDIDPSLSTEDKQALLDHTILGKKAAVWLQDNKNAASYYTADYNNQKAGGTLTEAGDDITNPSGAHYKAVAAQVDEQVNATYGLKKEFSGTSQTAFKNMLDPQSSSYNPDKATEVYKYDQARAAAGLPSKYDLTAAQKAIAKADAKGNGVGKSFSFPSLPSSLIGTGAGSGSTSKYANPSSLYQPIASLQTPTTAAIPKGRTISVSKIQTL